MNAAPAPHLASDLKRIVSGDVLEAEPLAPRVSIRAGGCAEVWVRPKTPDALVRLLAFTRAENVPLTVLGGGNNTLVGDGGIPGVTLALPTELFAADVAPTADGGRVTLGAGVAISRLVLLMKQNQWVGAEALAGIPGTLGGAVRMNAGTKHGECMASVEAVELATSEGLGWVDRAALAYRYRHTELPAGAIVTRVRFALRAGDTAQSRSAMDADLSYRKRTQPLSQPNFGSVFTNPPEDHAGRLIESVGLKGHREGGAQISPQHANWIVNVGQAKAADVLALMTLMQTRVREATGVELHPEVQKVGTF